MLDDGMNNRRNDFPYKFESSPSSPPIPPSSPPRIPTIVTDGAMKVSPAQLPTYKLPNDTKEKQKVQYIHHQRIPQTQKYQLSQNQYHQYYNQILSNSDPKQKKYSQVWSPQKPQAVVTRRSYHTLPQGPEYKSPSAKFSFIPPTKKFQPRTFQESGAPVYNPSGLLVPPPPMPPPYYNQQNRQDNGFFNPRFEKPFVFRIPTTTTPPPPTVGPAMSELLNVPAHFSANSDNVPSFAAKMFVVREAPYEFYPPRYGGHFNPNRPKINVQIPRTKFYCEEQKYLPGIYADSMLGCKVFHLCVPSSVGSTLTSYMCPNGTLFDQSILQCNFWYNVDCESSVNDYDANLALALSYRRINAAHMPLQAATNTGTLSLLSQNIDHLQVSNPKTTISKRMGRMLSVNEVDTSSQSSKNTDKKILPTSKESTKIYIHVNRTRGNKNNLNTSLIDEFVNNSSTSSILINETLNNTTNSSRKEEKSDFSGNEEKSDFSENEKKSDFSGNEEKSDFSRNEEKSNFSENEKKSDFSENEEKSDFSENERLNSSENEETSDFSDSTLRNLVVQIQKQFKVKKETELSKRLSFNLNPNYKSETLSSWTPIYKDKNSKFISINVDKLNV